MLDSIIDDASRTHRTAAPRRTQRTTGGAGARPRLVWRPRSRGPERVIRPDVGTDPNLALTTQRGTGYYKVPSLKESGTGAVRAQRVGGDPRGLVRRLRDDYVPTGYRGFRVERRAVPGYRFGLDPSDEDKRALIAFLKTL
jgi:hypothetical protein